MSKYMPDITIRSANIQDAQRISELTVQAYTEGGHLEAESSYVDVLQNILPRIDQTYVAADEHSAVIGAITLFEYGSAGTQIAHVGEAEFRFLAIDPKHWGSNIGRMLVSHVEEIALRLGMEAIIIRVIDTNERGLRLYDHLGYQRLPERDWNLPPRESACGVTNVKLLAFRKPLTARAVGA